MTPPDPDATGAAAGRPLFLPERSHAAGPEGNPGSTTAPHPAFRAGAAALLVTTAAIHNAAIQWLPDTRRLLVYAAVMAACAAAAWLLARRSRVERPSLLALDGLALAATVYVTGAGRSWLFWIVLLLAVDRMAAGWRSAALAAGVGSAAYLGVIGVAATVEGQALDPAAEAGKVAILALAGAWVTLVAWRAERARRRVAAELAEARALAADVAEDYDHLASSAQEERRERSAFLFRLAGEVRSPLRDLLRSTWAAERADGTGAGHAHLREIGVSARHVLDIVNEVMDLARVESGSLARELGPVSVRGALDDVLTQAIGAAERRRIRMPRHAPVDPGVWVLANDRKLRQLFANLISNAIKYNRLGGRVEVECEAGDDRLTVRVRDTGPGIPADRIEAAFEPFDRLGAEHRGIGGTGLGLPLARALAEAMGGELGVDTAPGAGSTFWFRLRLAAPPAADPGDGATAGPGGDGGAGVTGVTGGAEAGGGSVEVGSEAWEPRAWAAEEGVRPGRPALVLQVDASPDNAGRVGQALAGRPDVELLWTPLGLQGLETVAARRPVLVLLHVQLLDMPVEEVYRRLRETPGMGAVPIVAVAPHGAAPPELDRLLEQGALGPLTTPIQGEAVLELLRAALAGR